MSKQPNSIEKNPSEMQGVTQVWTNSPHTEHKRLAVNSHKPNSWMYPIPTESSPHPHISFIKISFNTILTSICRPPRDLIASGFPTRTVYTLLISYTTDDIIVGKATGYRLDDWGVGVRVPVGSRIFSPHRPDQVWGPPNLLSNG
jgi:hypothetical protein